MTLTVEQIRRQVMNYLEATECSVIEAAGTHVTVKLSPAADRMLTDRPYYWGFVDRTGAPPETLSFTFVFDPEAYDAAAPPAGQNRRTPNGAGAGAASSAPRPAGTGSSPGGGQAAGLAAGGAPGTPAPGGAGTADGRSDNPQEDSILSRYFGIVPALPRLGPGMIRREDVTYGSRRLLQIWSASRESGQYLQLFEEPPERQRLTLLPAAYEPWLGVCFKVELTCDLKREELHFCAVSLKTGRVDPVFGARIQKLKLTPRLPENIHIEPYMITLDEGAGRLEGWMTGHLAVLDYSWAEEARERLAMELQLVELYYSELLKEPDEEKRQQIGEQYDRRRKETKWQYEPHITVSAVMSGLFHLRST